jgi:transcriptional regulator with XRE-family HTH domain
MKILTEGAMNATFSRMTLRALLEQHGIHTIRDFAKRAGLTRQHAWNLWHAQAGVGVDMVKRLHERLQIPVEELIAVDRPTLPTHPQKRNKPRKRGKGPA